MIWVLPLAPGDDTDPLGRVHGLTGEVLAGVRGWLARSDATDTHLVVVTRHAVSASVYDRVRDLAHGAVWALVHSAQNEHPGRIGLLDIDDTAATDQALAGVLSGWPVSEPQLALRDGSAYIPRLARTSTLTPPPTPAWQLVTTGKGDLANLALVPVEPATVLAPGQVRVQVRAAGLNFRDVVVALGAIADEGLGGEAAGVVIEVAPDVTGLRPGDAVMGLFAGNAFAPTAITDQGLVVPIPAGWSFIQAASVPVAFLTAYIGLVEIGGLAAGQRVLIHAEMMVWARPRSRSLTMWVPRCLPPLIRISNTCWAIWEFLAITSRLLAP